jgi:hypothetical protein
LDHWFESYPEFKGFEISATFLRTPFIIVHAFQGKHCILDNKNIKKKEKKKKKR